MYIHVHVFPNVQSMRHTISEATVSVPTVSVVVDYSDLNVIVCNLPLEWEYAEGKWREYRS